MNSHGEGRTVLGAANNDNSMEVMGKAGAVAAVPPFTRLQDTSGTELRQKAASSDEAAATAAQLYLAPTAPSSLLFAPTTRAIKAYKCIQFFLCTWFVVGGLLPHHWQYVGMLRYNGALLSAVVFVLSGLLTELRYRDFVNSGYERTPFWRSHNPRLWQYLYCRVFRFAVPVALVAVWALVLNIFRGKTVNPYIAYAQYEDLPLTVPQVLLSLSLTSSWLNLMPVQTDKDSFFTPRHTTLYYAPGLLYASCFLVCWLLYPTISRFTQKYLGVVATHNRAKLAGTMLVLATALVSAVGTIVTITLTKNHTDETFKQMVDAESLVVGTAAWFVNPLWRLPFFFVGVLAGSLVHELGWAEPKLGGVTTAGIPTVQAPSEVRRLSGRWMAYYVVPYIADAVCLILGMIYQYDPIRVPPPPNPYVHKPRLDMSWYSNYGDKMAVGFGSAPWAAGGSLALTTWFYVAQWVCLPITVLALVLVACPGWGRSLFGLSLGLDPVFQVLPGRVAMIISLFFCAILSSSPYWFTEEARRGGGFFFVLLFLFGFSLTYYYYFYEPLNLWISLRLHEAALNADGLTAFSGAAFWRNSREVELGTVEQGRFTPYTRDNRAHDGTDSTVAYDTTDSGGMGNDEGEAAAEVNRQGGGPARRNGHEEGSYEHVPLQIWTSPQYDRFNIKDNDAELAAYQHLLSVKPPHRWWNFLERSWLHWAVGVFYRVHYTY